MIIMKKNSKFQLVIFLISVAIILGAKVVTPPTGLSQSGLMVLSTLIAALLMWMFIGLDWTCLFIIFAYMTIPDLGVNTVAANSFGSKTIVFFIAMFILASSLVTTGVAKRIAILIMTSNFSRKGPWMNVLMIFMGGFVLAQGLASPIVVVICFPILYEIFEMAGFEKGEETPKMLVLGTALVVQMAMGMTPICHAVVTTGLGTYNSYTGNTISIAEYCMIGIPTGIIIFILIFLMCKYIWKPDLKKLNNVDHEALKAKLGPMKTDAKIAIITYLIVIAFWILPGLSSYIPVLSFMKGISNIFPPIIAIAFLSIIRVEGKPVLQYNRALKEDVPWKIIIFSSSIQIVGASLKNTDIGVSTWLGEALTPVFGNINPIVFLILMVAFVIGLTNFISNSVTLAIAFAIGLPLTATVFAGSINVAAMSIILMSAANSAYATPAATHAIALTESSGWVDTKTIFKYGGLTAIATLVVYYFVSLPLGNMLFGL